MYIVIKLVTVLKHIIYIIINSEIGEILKCVSVMTSPNQICFSCGLRKPNRNTNRDNYNKIDSFTVNI